MSKSVKMIDIADKLGVSIVTVSKALSNKQGVSEELREKIKEVAIELGYKSSINNTKNENINPVFSPKSFLICVNPNIDKIITHIEENNLYAKILLLVNSPIKCNII